MHNWYKNLDKDANVINTKHASTGLNLNKLEDRSNSMQQINSKEIAITSQGLEDRYKEVATHTNSYKDEVYSSNQLQRSTNKTSKLSSKRFSEVPAEIDVNSSLKVFK